MVRTNLLNQLPQVILQSGLDERICATLHRSPDDMTQISRPLLQQFGGEPGLGLTVWLPKAARIPAIQFYQDLGCEVADACFEWEAPRR